MKKSILAIAVASLAASSAAIAEPTVYGNIHITLQQFDKSDGTGAGTDDVQLPENGLRGSFR